MCFKTLKKPFQQRDIDVKILKKYVSSRIQIVPFSKLSYLILFCFSFSQEKKKGPMGLYSYWLPDHNWEVKAKDASDNWAIPLCDRLDGERAAAHS